MRAVSERAAPSTVVLEHDGMSDAAKVLTALFVIVGAAIFGVLLYQLGQSNESDADLERSRIAQEQSRAGSPEPSAAPVSPVIVTTPAMPNPPGVTTQPAASDATADQAIVAYRASMDRILRRWTDATRTAEAASGANLASAIAAMRDVQRSAAMTIAPPVAAPVHGRLVSAMQAMIDEFSEAERRQIPLSDSPNFVQLQEQFDAVTEEYDALPSH